MPCSAGKSDDLSNTIIQECNERQCDAEIRCGSGDICHLRVSVSAYDIAPRRIHNAVRDHRIFAVAAVGGDSAFAATLLLQTVTRYKYRKWYFLIVALLPFVPEVIVYIAGSAPYTAVPDMVFKVMAVIIAWYAGGFYGGGCGEINGKNASGAYGNINSVHASNNEAYRGFRMYVRAPWYITASFLWQSGFSTHLILTVSRGVESMDPERRVSRGRLRAKRRR